MKQYRYIINDDLSIENMVDEIVHLPEYISCEKGLMQLVEPECDKGVIQKDLDYLNDALPKIEIFGMTSHGALSRDNHSVEFVVCSLMFFNESDFRIDVYDCSNGLTPVDAGLMYENVLSEVKDVKAVIMMSSDFALCPEKFIDRINEFNTDILVFGALAGTQKMGDDNSKIFVGNTIYERGILVVTLSGQNLFFDSYYNFGFKSLGKELTITKSDDSGIVYEIDNKPAFSVYKEHLGIGMNNYFFENTSSFPFYLRENGIGIARVALDYHQDGSLAFATDIPEGSAVSLSYSTSDILLNESAGNAAKLTEFYPEAILIYVCMSRRMLMGDDKAELELHFYESVKDSATWANGYAELLHADGLRGFLNASCVVVGMREGPIPDEEIRSKYSFDNKYLEEFRKERSEGYVPLSIRLVNFLESTTIDLRNAVDQLFKTAAMDELTQVYNRRSLNYYMEQYIEKHTMYKGVAVIMVDIDHFKHVNDTYGHDAGDLVLKNGVAKAKSIFSENDIIGRWGGEEFVCIKPGVSQSDAREFCETLRQGIADMEFDTVGHITVSVGITMINSGDTSDSVFKRIDDALYEAKETGRNKVVVR